MRELDYSEYECQGGPRSLFYVSKLAQKLQLNIHVPPSILLGFGENNRFMWNDASGKTVVKVIPYLEPELIQKFIYEHMILFTKSNNRNNSNGHDCEKVRTSNKIGSQEEEMLCPRFVLKIIGKYGSRSTIKLVYTADTLISYIMSSLSHGDLIAQPFIRQKHICKPSIIRYYMKSDSGVHKATSIVNKYSLDKNTGFYKNLMKNIQISYQKEINNAYMK